jgi:hypothetical protein
MAERESAKVLNLHRDINDLENSGRFTHKSTHACRSKTAWSGRMRRSEGEAATHFGCEEKRNPWAPASPTAAIDYGQRRP